VKVLGARGRRDEETGQAADEACVGFGDRPRGLPYAIVSLLMRHWWSCRPSLWQQEPCELVQLSRSALTMSSSSSFRSVSSLQNCHHAAAGACSLGYTKSDQSDGGSGHYSRERFRILGTKHQWLQACWAKARHWDTASFTRRPQAGGQGSLRLFASHNDITYGLELPVVNT